MTVPTCPKHGNLMRTGKYPGSFYCPHPDSEGPKGYCTYRVSEKPRSEGSNLGPTVHKIMAERVPEEPSTHPPYALTWQASDARVAAALSFAGQLYQACGGGQELEAKALLLAERALLMFERKP